MVTAMMLAVDLPAMCRGPGFRVPSGQVGLQPEADGPHLVERWLLGGVGTKMCSFLRKEA